jgi:hemolysin activation/secretion protein
MNIKTIRPFLLILGSSFLGVSATQANTTAVVSQKLNDQQLIHQQERQRALESQLTPSEKDIRLLDTPARSKQLDFPHEIVCFVIKQIILSDRDALPFTVPLYALARQAEGRCLGSEGVNLLMTELQNQLINYGYITTRVVAPPQDLTTGTLTLHLAKGTVSALRYKEGSHIYAKLTNTMPVNVGDLLNLRDIEQGLENLQRLPTARAEMELIPGENPGESDIVITRSQSKYWRVGVSLDDSGSRGTGRYQGGLTLYLDNPFQLSDSFYISGGRELDGASDRYGTQNFLIHYSVPFGYWQFSTTASGNKYYQTVAGIPSNYQYSGRSRNLNFQLSRIIHRNETQKTTLNYGVTLRRSHNYIDESEIEVQQRKTTSWQLGLQHRHYLGQNTLDLGIQYQKGVRWFGALQAPEEFIDEGTALSELFRYNLGLSVPFSVKDKSLRYNLDLQGQHTRRGSLTPQDRFSIGGRWSVRGFDGELTLAADRGFYVRQEVALTMDPHRETYLGIDYGQVYGPASELLLGHHLSGGALGVRGSLLGVNYDAFASIPIYKPELLKTDRVTFGFNLNWSY